MGAEDGRQIEQRDARASGRNRRGSTNNHSRLQTFAVQRKESAADWGGCNPARIQSVIVGIGGLGGAATFGYSRDGGAHFLTLLLDDDRTTLWFNGGADLDAELDSVIERLAQLYDDKL